MGVSLNFRILLHRDSSNFAAEILYPGPTHSQVGATYGISGKNRSTRSCNPESLLKHSLKRFVTVLTKYNKIEVYCTSIRFHNRSFGSITNPKTCPNEARWPYHMKSKTFSRLISHDRISISVTKFTEKQKHLSYSVSHTYTQIKWRFSNFVIKSGPSRLICYKTQFLTYCVYLGLLEIEMTN